MLRVIRCLRREPIRLLRDSRMKMSGGEEEANEVEEGQEVQLAFEE